MLRPVRMIRRRKTGMDKRRWLQKESLCLWQSAHALGSLLLCHTKIRAHKQQQALHAAVVVYPGGKVENDGVSTLMRVFYQQ